MLFLLLFCICHSPSFFNINCLLWKITAHVRVYLCAWMFLCFAFLKGVGTVQYSRYP